MCVCSCLYKNQISSKKIILTWVLPLLLASCTGKINSKHLIQGQSFLTPCFWDIYVQFFVSVADGMVFKFAMLPYWSDRQSRAICGTTAAWCDSCCSRRSPRSSASWTCEDGGGRPVHPWTQHTASGQSQLQARPNTREASLVTGGHTGGFCSCHRQLGHIPIAFPSSLVDPVKILERQFQT